MRRTFAKGRAARRTPGTMNGLEAKYAATLAIDLATGNIAAYWFEAVTLKLAPDTRYTPDFLVMHNDGTLEFREVKGFMEDDAWVKLKVAADKFPFRFTLIRQKLKREGGGWDVKELNTEGAAGDE